MLDVKVGDGAFMKNIEDAVELSKIMVSIGERFGRKVAAVITDMDSPLGCAIGNALEVRESCEILQGRGPDDLREVCLSLAANMLCLAGKGTYSTCLALAKNTLQDGSAYEKFKQMIEAQSGDLTDFESENYDSGAKIKYDVLTSKSGYINSMGAEHLGKASMILGAGREKKEDSIDYSAGILLHKKTGEYVKEGGIIATFYSSDEYKCLEAEKIFKEAVVISESEPPVDILIKARITADGIEKF